MKIKNTALVMSVFLALAGCQSTGDKSGQSELTNAEQKEAAFEAFERVKGDYQTWQVTVKDAESLKIYSSTLYKALKSDWEEVTDVYEDIAAKPSITTKSYSIFSSGTYENEFDEQLALVKKNYEELQALKVIADDILAEAQAQMKYLDLIEAKKFYAVDYKSVKSLYLGLYKKVEDQKIDQAQTAQVAYLNKAKTLEQKVVLKQYVSPLEKELSTLSKQNFNQIAPISYKKAKAEISLTEQTVRANTRDINVIKEAVASANFELNHVREVALEVKKLSSVQNNKFEPVILEFENKLLKLSKAAGDTDYRDRSLREQAENILDDIRAMASQLETAKLSHTESVNALDAENITLKQTISEKEAEARQAQAQNELLTSQLEQSKSHIAKLEALLDAYNPNKAEETAEVAAEEQVAAEEAVEEKTAN